MFLVWGPSCGKLGEAEGAGCWHWAWKTNVIVTLHGQADISPNDGC